MRPRQTWFRSGRKPIRMLIVIIAVLAGSLVLAQPASAASDGQDPVAAGCSGDAYTARSTGVAGVGVVELRYSPACGANWIKVTSYIGTTSMIGVVWRPSDGVSYAYPYNRQPTWTTSLYTDLVYAPTTTACGNGYIAGNWSATLCA